MINESLLTGNSIGKSEREIKKHNGTYIASSLLPYKLSKYREIEKQRLKESVLSEVSKVLEDGKEYTISITSSVSNLDDISAFETKVEVTIGKQKENGRKIKYENCITKQNGVH